jgi:hypothetical protein
MVNPSPASRGGAGRLIGLAVLKLTHRAWTRRCGAALSRSGPGLLGLLDFAALPTRDGSQERIWRREIEAASPC